ncbi:MAG: hypothetical protein V3U37_03025, partial [Nitrospinaceae bacterium]
MMKGPAAFPLPIFFTFYFLFISPALSAENSGTLDQNKLSRHLLLLTKKSIVVQQEINSLLEKPPSKERAKKFEKLEDQLE